MTPKHCDTDCREDLIAKLECKVSRGGMFKLTGLIVTIVIALWGIGYTINTRGIDKRETDIKENHKSISQTREEVAAINATLQNIERSQSVILRILRGRDGRE